MDNFFSFIHINKAQRVNEFPRQERKRNRLHDASKMRDYFEFKQDGSLSLAGFRTIPVSTQ